MIKIESDPKIINKTDITIFNFLSDFRNFDKLMPDKVVNWQATENTCYFTISGLTSLGMEITGKYPYTMIKIRENKRAPFEFDFIINLEKINEEQTRVMICINAEMNPMLSIMLSKPLKSFLEFIILKIDTIII